MLFLGERNTIDVKFFKDLLLTIFFEFHIEFVSNCLKILVFVLKLL